MSLALALLAVLAVQDTAGLSPRARAMLDEFPPPRGGAVTIATRFSSPTAWIGEQVELVTAAWFPRELRDRLRRPPTLRAPALGGLWSAPSGGTPVLAGSRIVGGEIYDLFVAHQTLFPLGAGTVASPPAVLTYAVPTSVSFFAPEERKSLASAPARLVVRPIPPTLTRALGAGPTARGLRLAWRAPPEGLRVGTPAAMELVIAGEGNVTLWPAPEVAWPAGLRVYPEPAEERLARPDGRIAGEKRFRFTVVPDSAGVVTLPGLRYPYFDPAAVTVRVAEVEPLGLAVQPTADGPVRPSLPVVGVTPVPLASRAVREGWPLLLVLALLPLGGGLRRRRRPAVAGPAVPGSPDAALRRLLGTPVDAAPDRVAAALRRQGVSAPEARAVATWLAGHQRARYGPGTAAPVVPPPEVEAVLRRLRRARPGPVLLALVCLAGVGPLSGQTPEGVVRYRGGDPAGAARAFAAAAVTSPTAPAAWRNLGAARWSAGDDVGAVAAWLRALELAPRDPLTRAAWREATGVPREVVARAPRLPLSRDELVLLTLGAWLVAGGCWWTGRRRASRIALAVAVGCALPAVLRTRAERDPPLLVRPGTALRVSPLSTAPVLGTPPAWSIARRARVDGQWWLVQVEGGARGWVPSTAVAPVGALD